MIIGNLLETDNPAEKATLIGKYFITVFLALSIHAVIVMPLLYYLVCRKNPLTVVRAMTQSLITTFGTSSRFVFYKLIKKYFFYTSETPLVELPCHYLFNA